MKHGFNLAADLLSWREAAVLLARASCGLRAGLGLPGPSLVGTLA